MKTKLIIYGNGTSGIDAEHYYQGKFDCIVHSDSQFFDKPRRGVTHFALECFHTDHILKIRKACLEAGVEEASRNKPTTATTPNIEPVVEPAPKPQKRKRRTPAEMKAAAEAQTDGIDNDTSGE